MTKQTNCFDRKRMWIVKKCQFVIVLDTIVMNKTHAWSSEFCDLWFFFCLIRYNGRAHRQNAQRRHLKWAFDIAVPDYLICWHWLPCCSRGSRKRRQKTTLKSDENKEDGCVNANQKKRFDCFRTERVFLLFCSRPNYTSAANERSIQRKNRKYQIRLVQEQTDFWNPPDGSHRNSMIWPAYHMGSKSFSQKVSKDVNQCFIGEKRIWSECSRVLSTIPCTLYSSTRILTY